MSEVVVLIPGDSETEQKIEISRKAACQSKLMDSMLAEDTDPETPEIPLLEVSKPILDRVVDFLLHHVDDPMAEIKKPIENRKGLTMSEVVSKWDADFIDAMENDHETLFKVILAANYLDIEPLLDLGITKVACMLQNCKDIEEVKKLLNIEKDITPEEEKIVREQNQWIFDLHTPTSN